MEKYFYYTKDQNFIEFHGRMIPNPLPPHLRARRQTVVGIIENGKMIFGRSEAKYPDTFSRKKGKEEAIEKALRSPLLSVDVPHTEKRHIVKFFIRKAKTLLRKESVYEPQKKVVITWRKVGTKAPDEPKRRLHGWAKPAESYMSSITN